jgi:anti-sigma factor RsiW
MKPQDFDRLSAYIDDQLSPAEKAALEQRLGREPELRSALSELRLTVTALRALPPVKPPRNFTLTPAMAGLPDRGRPQPRRSLFGTLRLAASLSALALAVVAGGDFAATQGLLGNAAPAQEIVFTAESSTGAAADASLTPSLDTVAPEAEGEITTLNAQEGEEPAGGADTPPGAEATLEAEATPDIAAALLPVTETPSAERSAAATAVAQTDADETATSDLFQAESVPAEATEDPKAVPAPELTEEALLYASEVQAPQPEPQGLPPIRVIEAALAMLTVLLGLGAWLSSRNT